MIALPDTTRAVVPGPLRFFWLAALPLGRLPLPAPAATGARPIAAPLGAAAFPPDVEAVLLAEEPEHAASRAVPPLSRASAIIFFVLRMLLGRSGGRARFRGYGHDCAGLVLRVMRSTWDVMRKRVLGL
jgi:hypothetical protein